jgi:hypothetical protein
MPRLKCKKCGAVFEINTSSAVAASFIHIGPLSPVKCPACGKRSWMNIYSSVKDPVTWPEPQKEQQVAEPQMSEQELEKKRIEESKYERS